MTDRYLSFYFDTSVSPVLYGVTLWSGTVENVQQPNGFYSDSQTTQVKIQLLEAESGSVVFSELADLVSHYYRSHLTKGSRDLIILDSVAEMKVLEKTLKTKYHIHQIKLAERETTIGEQIAKYSLMFNRDRFYTEGFMIEPDLIFDDLGNTNLIDRIHTDEQDKFPKTQSLLIACHHLEKCYKSYHMGSLGTTRSYNPFSGYSSGRRDHSFFG